MTFSKPKETYLIYRIKKCIQISSDVSKNQFLNFVIRI